MLIDEGFLIRRHSDAHDDDIGDGNREFLGDSLGATNFPHPLSLDGGAHGNESDEDDGPSPYTAATLLADSVVGALAFLMSVVVFVSIGDSVFGGIKVYSSYTLRLLNPSADLVL
jgi:hypothetical protein